MAAELLKGYCSQDALRRRRFPCAAYVLDTQKICMPVQDGEPSFPVTQIFRASISCQTLGTDNAGGLCIKIGRSEQ